MSREADSDDAARRREPGGVTGPEPLPGWPSDASAGLAPTDQPDEPGRRRGRINYQDENTAPREPTLAEQRAHQQAQKQAIEDEQARLAAEAAAAKKRKRMLIGGGAVAGVAALIAVGYAVSGNDEPVEARCVDENNVVVDDSNCVTPASNTASAGGYYGGGFFPIFLGGGGRQYHYNYGGSGGIGQTATGGTTVAPKDATVRSATSGRTISRGGFGVSSSSGSAGGAKAGSSSGS
ncbi:MAG: hypothetical protein ACT4O0_14760 [Pseudonocardia sp.]